MTTAAEGEVEALRQRLAEVEGTLEAIRRGDVDALVVAGPSGPQVFTLQGAQDPYRMLVERMNDGALTVAADGTVLYCNRRFAELTETPLEQVVGRSLLSWVPAGRHDSVEQLLQEAVHQPLHREMTFVRSGRSLLPALVWAGPLDTGDEPTLLVTVTDLTARLHTEELASAERFARSLLEQATEAVVVCDTTGRITHLSRAAERLSGSAAAGRPFHDVFPLDLLPSDHEALLEVVTGIAPAGNKPACLQGIEVTIGHRALKDRHFLLSAGPLTDSGGNPMGCTVTLTDITERKRGEEHQAMLVAELNHRVKNILAIVRSVASQTITNSASLTAFKGAFDGRLRALALAHDILTMQRWADTRLSHLVAESLAPYRGLGADRVTTAGPEVLLPTQIVVPLAMTLHELTTNAVKYGALSAKTGRLEVNWVLTEDAGLPCVAITWTELGGPPVAARPATGFGTKLISRLGAYDLDGNAHLDFKPEGLTCTLRFPISERRNLLATVEAG